jgi:hypothetical protein
MPFESWVERALEKWPDVPALYGWLSLDRRGRWRIRGETISRPQIIDTIGANYAADARGCWFFQNGPQRGYVALEWTPFVLRRGEGDLLVTHTGRPVAQPRAAYLEEEGSLLITTEHGAGGVDAHDLDWALPRLHADHGADVEDAVLAALASPSGSRTRVRLSLAGRTLPVERLDDDQAPGALGFVREPRP